MTNIREIRVRQSHHLELNRPSAAGDASAPAVDINVPALAGRPLRRPAANSPALRFSRPMRVAALEMRGSDHIAHSLQKVFDPRTMGRKS
jgi:hypothetical protein